MSHIEQISGSATAHTTMTAKPGQHAWMKTQADVRPCGIAGCDKEGIFLPILVIHGKSDTDKSGRFYVALLPIVLCPAHATQDPKEYQPDDVTRATVAAALGEEPDFDTMHVQFMGNDVCRVDHARNKGAELTGLFEHYYESKPASGKPGLRTRKVEG